MFDLLTLSPRDAAMLGSGAIAIASALVGVAVAHKIKPAVSAWLVKEKPTVLALEDKMRSAFGMASRAIADVEAKAKVGDDTVRKELAIFVGSLHDDNAAIVARVEALEALVFGAQGKTNKPPVAP